MEQDARDVGRRQLEDDHRLGDPEALPPSVDGDDRATQRPASIRAEDIEPYFALQYVARLFKIAAMVVIVALTAEVIAGMALEGVGAILPLFAEVIRGIVLAAILWGVGDLTVLFIDVGHDVRAARVLLGRISARMAADAAAAQREDLPPRLNGRPDPLDRIVIVLWQTQDLVNIASTIRAMKNFGLRRLRLVSPAEWDPWRIEGIAHDTQDIVESTEQFDTLEDALADCSYTVAMTARGRRAKRAVGRPRDVAPEILDRAVVPDAGPIAIVFGREDAGLPNSALDLCHRSVTIPTNPEHASLNLAQAVLVITYELWMAHEGREQQFKPPRRNAPPANIHILERTFEDVEAALWSIDFFKSRQTESVMRTLRELAHRADLDQREAGFLRAMAIEVSKFIKREL